MAGAVVFYGSGSVWNPGRKGFIRFTNGTYSTSDPVEIALLGAKYRHDRNVPVVVDIQAIDDAATDMVDTSTESTGEVTIEKPRRGRRPKDGA